MNPGEELLFCALGGSGEIGMNVNLYGCRGQWIMVDCGLTFAGPDYPGIDLILPDLEFIERQNQRLAGVALAHSIPEAFGLLIETPFGRVFHSGDWKIDEAPVLGEVQSTELLTRIGDQ